MKGAEIRMTRFSLPTLATMLPVVVVTAVAAPSAWGKDFCSVPKSDWQPQAALTRKLEGEGWKIRNLKIDSGCYEVYGTDGSGKARETHFNPHTFQPVAENHRSY
jgi:hypothetical protein